MGIFTYSVKKNWGGGRGCKYMGKKNPEFLFQEIFANLKNKN